MASSSYGEADQQMMQIDEVMAYLDLTHIQETEGEKDTNEEQRKDSSVQSNQNGSYVKSIKKSTSLKDNLKKFLPMKGSDKNPDDVANSNGSQQRRPMSKRSKDLDDVKVDKLPQGFVCKFIGAKPCEGLWGVRHTRRPVVQLIEELQQLTDGDDLPLVNVKISAEGVKATLHPHNRSNRPLSDSGLLPLQFISYAVQDPRLSRLFAFILVREMSSRKRKTECHVYLCASDVLARKMALSMAMAFDVYHKALKGKPHKFQVDLRSTDEIENELSTKSTDGVVGDSEFDA